MAGGRTQRTRTPTRHCPAHFQSHLACHSTLAHQDETTHTFTNCVRTIKALRPKGVILENVLGLIKTGCLKEVKVVLGRIPGYVLQVIQLDAADFGIPQHRARIYIIMLRTDVLRGAPAACQTLITKIVERCKVGRRIDFSTWCARLGCPITPVRAAGSAGSTEQVVCNGCGINKSCEKHVCQCLQCKTHNPSKKLCKWRASMRLFVCSPAERRKTQDYLAQWKTIKKDSKLKKPPSYFEMAVKKKLNVVVNSPRERCLLEVLSMGRNLHSPSAILDLSQSISRVAFRSDGLAPTLGTGCGGLFVPSAGVHLTPQQCLSLQGVSLAGRDLTGMSNEQLHRLAGNAMTVPVVGVVMWATVCTLAPQ